MNQNMNAGMLAFLAQRAQTQIQGQIAQLRQQTTLRGVVSLLHPQVPGHLRSLVKGTPAARQLQATGESVAKRIIDKQLEEINTMPPKEARARFGQLYTTDWQLLRGNFPRLAQEIERERLSRRSSSNLKGE